MEFNDELKALVDEVANRVDRWTAQRPGPGSRVRRHSGDREHGGTAGRHAVGDRPVRTAYPYAQMAAKLAVRCPGAPRCSSGRAARRRASRQRPGSALEAGSVAWWLLEPGLTARERVCRMQLLRRNSARELRQEHRRSRRGSGRGGEETVAGIEAECRALGLGAFTQER